jgi:tRNA(Ile)-lysidine synthetase-like protein
MQVVLKPGKYIVAVSGGVDSVVLLDILARQEGAQLIVAHFDHGIREDSGDDRLFVQRLAGKYGLPFVFDIGNLGKNASEAAAREARYVFLRRVKLAADARAIILAHHEDDLLETAILNMLRGTGRKGLSSLKSTTEIYRPLLHTPKANIIDYARAHGLEWHEDSTNVDTKYLRNHIRHNILSRFDAPAREHLKQLVSNMQATNEELDKLLANQLQVQPSEDMLDRRWFVMLPHDVAREVMALWLRLHDIRDFDKKTIERLVAQAKTLPNNKQIDIDAAYVILVKPGILALARRDR